MDADAQPAPLAEREHWVASWCAITHQARRWHSALEEALQPHELSTSELLVLWRTSLAALPGITQVELARELIISAAQICGIVDGLAARGWLQRVRPQHDRRRLVCSLTPLGRETLSQLIRELTPVARSLSIDTAERTSFPRIRQEAA